MNNRIKLKTLNIFYLFGVLIFLTVGNFVQSWNLEIGLIITEYVFVLGLSFIIIKFSKAKTSDYVHLRDISKRTTLKIVLIMMLSLPIVMFLNLLSLFVLESFGFSLNYSFPIATDFTSVVFQFFIISISAGICEEVFFRGIILNTYSEYFSYWKAIIISAVLFGIFHFNILNILGPIYLGIVFGYLAIRTKSIIPAILGHMTNNGLAYILAYIGSVVEVKGVDMVLDASTLLDTILGLSFIVVFSFGIVLYILKSIPGIDLKDDNREKKEVKKNYFIPLIIVGIIYIGYTTYLLF